VTNFRNWLEKAQEIRSGIPRIRGVKGLPGVLSRGELSVVYQPIVSLTTMEPFAYEALVRSDSPHWTTPPKLFEEAINSRCVGALGRAIREIATANCTNAPLFLNVHPNEFDESWLVQPDDPIFTHDQPVYLEVTEEGIEAGDVIPAAIEAAGGVVVAGERVADEDGVVPRGVELAVGLVHEVVGGQHPPAGERQGLVEVLRLRRDQADGAAVGVRCHGRPVTHP